MKYDTLLIKCTFDLTSRFMQELQKGFYISSFEGNTIYSFLTDSCGISDMYITSALKTVLVDGGPVDDIFNSKIKDGGVCALSGAMPGIVGAMMRIGSPYAAMRQSITAKNDEIIESGVEINFGLKLFNIILSDLGLEFLKKGILLDKQRIYELFNKPCDDIYSGCTEIILNGHTLKKNESIYERINKKNKLLIFKIEIEDEI